MNYRVFYGAARLGDVASENAVEMPLADVRTSILPLIKDDKEFFGLVDANDVTLQAMYEADTDQFWFEVPRPELRGCYGRMLTFEAAPNLLESLTGPIAPGGYGGFEFEAW